MAGSTATTLFKGGFRRFPHFLRSLVSVIRHAKENNPEQIPNLINPQVNPGDLCTTLVIAAAFFLLRLFLHRNVFSHLFSAFPRKSRSKLSENLFYAVYYITAVLYYLFAVRPNVTWTVDLFSNNSSIVKSLMNPIPPPMEFQELLYYCQAAGFYLSASFFLILFDGRRSDFNVLILHHTVTIALVAMSYIYGYVRTGIVILALHDLGDIFLYSAKFVHHLGIAGVDTALFTVFAVTFYVTRLLMYSRLVHAVSVETLQTVVLEPSFNNWAQYFHIYIWHYGFFVVFLGTLQILHCFWFALILKMIYREVVLGKKISEEGDIRSDGEDDVETVQHDEIDEDDNESVDGKSKHL